jgi:alkylhydroperoxidase/carboxymuconolactone decarboxylase family protein YurZ
MASIKGDKTANATFEEGMTKRRAVLGEDYVDASKARLRPHNEEFIDFIVRAGWGEVWTRPGLDVRTRRILVMGTMVALGAYEEFVMHARAALKDGMSLNDIKEMLLQQAVYAGAPRANHAFYLMDALVDELTAAGVAIKDLK